MKNALLILSTIFYIACGSSGRNTTAHHHTSYVPEVNIHSYYDESLDMTVLTTDSYPVRYRTEPYTLRTGATGLYTSLSAVHLTNRLTRTPRFVGFNLSSEHGSPEVPGNLLLINVRSKRWIKVEAEKINDVYTAYIPLTAMEQFLHADQNSVVGFLGEQDRFVQFAVNDDVCYVFKRFMRRLHETVSVDPYHPFHSNLPN